jgi:hypothetical protein
MCEGVEVRWLTSQVLNRRMTGGRTALRILERV